MVGRCCRYVATKLSASLPGTIAKVTRSANLQIAAFIFNYVATAHHKGEGCIRSEFAYWSADRGRDCLCCYCA